jgi:glycosyltransferase involved in cell wall biosynthesis
MKSRCRSTLEPSKVESPRFTVLICTHNRPERLAQTLDTMGQLEYAGGWELLVVDNASNDGRTEAVVKTRTATYPAPLRYIREDRIGKVAALNTGIANARGEVVAFTDDDADPVQDWIVRYDEAFHTTKCDWAFGPVKPNWETSPPPWYSAAVNGLFGLLDYGDTGFTVTERAFAFFGVNCAATRDALTRLGGYREEFAYVNQVGGGEDIDIFQRALAAGMRIQYVPGAIVTHFIGRQHTRKDFHRRRTFRGAPQNFRLMTENAASGPRVLGLPRYIFRLAIEDMGQYLRRTFRGDSRSAFPYELRLVRFAGLFRHALMRNTSAGRTQ